MPALVGALTLAALAVGGVLAGVMGGSDGDGRETQAKVKTVTQATTVQGDATTVIQTTTAEAEPETTETMEPPGNGGGGLVSLDEAMALTDEATGLMAEGNYADALPLARRAYKSLRGSGDIYEGYAAYNAGKSWIELGKCNKGLPLLDASEEIQGHRDEIDAARTQCS